MRVAHGASAMVALAAILTAESALGAGFAIKEQSATALGNAFAGATAGGEDLSYMFFNPAVLGRFDGNQAQLAVSGILTKLNLEEATASTTGGTPITGSNRDGDAAHDAVVPAFYAMASPHEQIRLGIGVNVPFGLGTEYSDGWVGRYHAIESTFETVNFNPVVAVKATDWLTLAAGAQIQYAEAELTNAIDFGSIGAANAVPGSVPTQQDGQGRVKGDGWAYGYNLGIHAEPVKGTRIGISYRSKIDTTFEGNARFRLDDAGIGATLKAATGAFANTGAETKFEFPPMAGIGVHQAIGEDFAVMAEAQWTGWSTLDELIIKFDNPSQPDNVSEYQWNDSWFFALGGSWDATRSLKLRVGVAWDQSPVRNRYRSPRVPDSDRYWLATGLGWQIRDNLSLDLGYTHIFFEDADVDQSGTDPGNAARGNLEASYENHIDIVTLSLVYRF